LEPCAGVTKEKRHRKDQIKNAQGETLGCGLADANNRQQRKCEKKGVGFDDGLTQNQEGAPIN